MAVLQNCRRPRARRVLSLLTILSLWICITDAFAPRNAPPFVARRSLLFHKPLVPPTSNKLQLQLTPRPQSSPPSSPSLWKRLFRRLDVLESAGFDRNQVLTAGVWSRIKQLHNPITYLVVAGLAGLRWDWCFRNPYYWFGVAFCIKWYRARYVFKIPVWDRQPNWNNIITSKEQEKDLKAYTCKNCGSTIFIAKTREFFFEGNTGIGGLGCFACGAKGKDNFVMDRDRIVEDVADEDDYFEYERPLDFVSRAERRKILKETKGDEEKANQLLVERTAGNNADAGPTVVEAEVVVDESPPSEETPVQLESEPDLEEETAGTSEAETTEVVDATPEPATNELYSPPPPKPQVSDDSDDDEDVDDLDLLDMDDF